MRDPDRIDKICDKLKEYWHRVPDWRLGQIISNSLQLDGHLFYIEDDDMMESIDNFFTFYKQYFPDDIVEAEGRTTEEHDRLRGYLMEELIDCEQSWVGLLDPHIKTVLECYDRAKERFDKKEGGV